MANKYFKVRNVLKYLSTLLFLEESLQPPKFKYLWAHDCFVAVSDSNNLTIEIMNPKMPFTHLSSAMFYCSKNRNTHYRSWILSET